MQFTSDLRDDHDLILEVLEYFESGMSVARADGRVDAAAFTPFVQFFGGFADHCHHAKEERALFPAMVRAGFPAEAGPIGCMLEEHAQGRELLTAMNRSLAAAGDDPARALDDMLEAGARYVHLLRNHIAKENGVLFVMADNLLAGAEARRVHEEIAALAGTADQLDMARRARQLVTRMEQVMR